MSDLAALARASDRLYPAMAHQKRVHRAVEGVLAQWAFDGG